MCQQIGLVVKIKMFKLKNIFYFSLLLSLFYCGILRAEVSIVTPEVYELITERLNIEQADIKKYKRIFRAIEQGNFESADKLVVKIDNPILMGHVLAEKYLHQKYKSSADELAEWLNLYRDHPQAQRIYNLALKKGVKEPKDPVFAGSNEDISVQKLSLKYLERLNNSDRKFLVRQAKSFKNLIRQGKTLAARQILENKRFQKLAPKTYWDNLAATLALKYLVDNYDRKALEWGIRASKRHNSGTATWVAGLASWRMKNYKAAASYFARLGSSKNSDEWLKSAGAYWSARAYEKLGNHLKAQEMLKLAALNKYTFYGILSAYALGAYVNFDFSKNMYMNDFDKLDYVDELIQSDAIKRALVLFDIKQPELAEKELFAAYDGLSDNQKEAVILLANQHGLHSLVINIAKNKNIEQLTGNYEKEMYPLPRWTIDKNWQVDKALVLALIRQESAFKDNATSKAGARGLMQLMPNTAYHISGDKLVKRQKSKLLDLDYNLDLGQRYVSYLLDKPFIEGNLFYMLTAYNGGPGNLVKWQKNARYGKDPLLFIEVLPSAETRIYIERVMANYWIYNARFGKENHTLKQLVSGMWPLIDPMGDIDLN